MALGGLPRPRREYVCEDCGGPPTCPMIDDPIWLSIATEKTLLCLGCFEKRVGRRILIEDLRNCLANDEILLMLKRFAPDVFIGGYQGIRKFT